MADDKDRRQEGRDELAKELLKLEDALIAIHNFIDESVGLDHAIWLTQGMVGSVRQEILGIRENLGSYI